MVARFKCSPAAGAVGLYTVPTPTSTDDSPLTDPLNHLDRVIFHPALRYPGVVATITGTLSLAAFTTGGFSLRRATHVLGAHGRAGRPMIIGKLLGIGSGGAAVPWCGSVPVQQYQFGSYGRILPCRWLSLGVQGANIVCFEHSQGSAATMGALSLSFEILVLDRDLSATLPNSGPTRIRINGSAFEFVTPKGTLSSETRYMRQASGGSAFALSGGRTATIRYNHTVGTSVVKETTFKWSAGSGVYEVAADYTTLSATPTYLPADAVGPVVQTVKL